MNMQPSLFKAAEESSSWKINICMGGNAESFGCYRSIIMLSSRLGKMSFLWPAASLSWETWLWWRVVFVKIGSFYVLPVTLQILEQILNSHVEEVCRSVVISPSHENFGAPLVPRRNSKDFSELFFLPFFPFPESITRNWR